MRTTEIETSLVLDDVKNSINHLKSMGFTMSNNRYKKSFALLETYASGKLNGEISVVQAWNIAELFDLSSVVQIMRGELKDFQEKIPHILDGGSIEAEIKTNPRDIFFELKIAARLRSIGAKIIKLGLTDVAFTYCGRDFALECKRVQSGKKIKHRIEYAQEQMKRKAIPIDKSIVALDLSKLAFKYFLSEESWPPSSKNVREIRDRIQKKLIVEQIAPVIDLVKETSFLLCHFRIPTVNPYNEFVTINHFFTVSDPKTASIGRSKLIRALRPRS